MQEELRRHGPRFQTGQLEYCASTSLSRPNLILSAQFYGQHWWAMVQWVITAGIVSPGIGASNHSLRGMKCLVEARMFTWLAIAPNRARHHALRLRQCLDPFQAASLGGKFSPISSFVAIIPSVSPHCFNVTFHASLMDLRDRLKSDGSSPPRLGRHLLACTPPLAAPCICRRSALAFRYPHAGRLSSTRALPGSWHDLRDHATL